MCPVDFSSAATGSPTASGGTLRPHLPGDRASPTPTFALAGADDIDRAVASAWEAHREWMSLTVDRRRDLLIDLADAVHENLDELARLNVHDYAVPISFAGNAILLERFLRHFAGYVDKPHGVSTPVTGSFDINLIEREPYGVVGVITPWNGSLVVTRILCCAGPGRGKRGRAQAVGGGAVGRAALRRTVPRGRPAGRAGQRCTRRARGRRRSCAPSRDPQDPLHRR